MRIWKTTYLKLPDVRKRDKGLDKCVEEYGCNDLLKGIYLKKFLAQNKEYEWDQIYEQTFE